MARLVLIKEPEKCLRALRSRDGPGASDDWKDVGSTLKRSLFLAKGNRCGRAQIQVLTGSRPGALGAE